MEEDSIPKALWNKMREIGREEEWSNPASDGREKEEMLPSPLPQLKEHTKGLLPLLPYLRIDFSSTGVA